MPLSAAPMHGFVPVSSGDRAIAFYRDVLGLRLVANTPFAAVFDVPGGELRCAITPAFTPQPFTVIGWQVDDIAVAMADLARKTISFERFDGLPQDETGVWNTPDGARICWFKDPDGNVLSLMQPPPT
ncbi:MAG: VOC family protein [Pseudomonadota bacterium]